MRIALFVYNKARFVDVRRSVSSLSLVFMKKEEKKSEILITITIITIIIMRMLIEL